MHHAMHESHARSENTNMQGVHDDEGVRFFALFLNIMILNNIFNMHLPAILHQELLSL
jgi:hypothetical protein